MFYRSIRMQNGRSTSILVCLSIVFLLSSVVEGRSFAHRKDITNTIKSLRHDIHKVLHFIDHLSEDVESKGIARKGDKSRSVIPPYQGQLNHLLADESVIKATANKAAKAVADSSKATLTTQKGVKQIAEGLVQLKTCLEAFEKVIKL